MSEKQQPDSSPNTETLTCSEQSEPSQPYTPQHHEPTSSILDQGGYNNMGVTLGFDNFSTQASPFFGFSNTMTMMNFSGDHQSPLHNYSQNTFYSPQDAMSSSHQLLQQYFL